MELLLVLAGAAIALMGVSLGATMKQENVVKFEQALEEDLEEMDNDK